MLIWMKNLIETFFVKTYERNFSYGTKMVQLFQYTSLEKQIFLTNFFH
jgi:hypothetical protein